MELKREWMENKREGIYWEREGMEGARERKRIRENRVWIEGGAWEIYIVIVSRGSNIKNR